MFNFFTVMKKKIFVLFFVLTSFYVCAQQDSVKMRPHPKQTPEPDFWSQTFTGGNFGLQFGSETMVDISPLFGYKITDQFSIGVGGTYDYYHYQLPPYDFVSSVYGGRVFAEYTIFDNIFAHVEYEELNVPQIDYFSNRATVNSVLVGAGYAQPIGENSSYNIMLLFDTQPSTIYVNPIFRIGFVFGL